MIVQCRDCPKVFDTQSQLEKHSEVRHRCIDERLLKALANIKLDPSNLSELRNDSEEVGQSQWPSLIGRVREYQLGRVVRGSSATGWEVIASSSIAVDVDPIEQTRSQEAGNVKDNGQAYKSGVAKFIPATTLDINNNFSHHQDHLQQELAERIETLQAEISRQLKSGTQLAASSFLCDDGDSGTVECAEDACGEENGTKNHGSCNKSKDYLDAGCERSGIFPAQLAKPTEWRTCDVIEKLNEPKWEESSINEQKSKLDLVVSDLEEDNDGDTQQMTTTATIASTVADKSLPEPSKTESGCLSGANSTPDLFVWRKEQHQRAPTSNLVNADDCKVSGQEFGTSECPQQTSIRSSPKASLIARDELSVLSDVSQVAIEAGGSASIVENGPPALIELHGSDARDQEPSSAGNNLDAPEVVPEGGNYGEGVVGSKEVSAERKRVRMVECDSEKNDGATTSEINKIAKSPEVSCDSSIHQSIVQTQSSDVGGSGWQQQTSQNDGPLKKSDLRSTASATDGIKAERALGERPLQDRLQQHKLSLVFRKFGQSFEGIDDGRLASATSVHDARQAAPAESVLQATGSVVKQQKSALAQQQRADTERTGEENMKHERIVGGNIPRLKPILKWSSSSGAFEKWPLSSGGSYQTEGAELNSSALNSRQNSKTTTKKLLTLECRSGGVYLHDGGECSESGNGEDSARRRRPSLVRFSDIVQSVELHSSSSSDENADYEEDVRNFGIRIAPEAGT